MADLKPLSKQEQNMVRRGNLPWSLEGLTEVMDFIGRLKGTPLDDWDLGYRGIKLVGGGDRTEEIRLNMTNIEVQFSVFITERYMPDQVATHANLWRFIEILAFLHDHRRVLLARGLAKADNGKDVQVFALPLLKALAVLPFNGTRKTGPEVCPTFDCDEVVICAEQIAHNEYGVADDDE